MSLYEPLFRALNEAGVRYVVVGGLAVVLHGHARLTVDVDLAIDLAPEEATKAISALVGLGMTPRAPVDPMDFANEATRLEWFRERHMRVFTMVDPANPMRAVDLFVENPMPFDVLWRNSIAMALWNAEVHVASIPDLIQMKRQAGRPRDLDDIDHLTAIMSASREASADE